MAKYVVFHLSGKTCALPLEEVLEVLPTAELIRPPRIPSLLAGFLNLGGQAVPVLCLDRVLGLPDHKPGLYTHILLVRGERRGLAFLVERATGVIHSLSGEHLEVKSAESFNGCTTGMARLGGQVIHILSTSRILLEEERATIEEFARTAQERIHAMGVTQGGSV